MNYKYWLVGAGIVLIVGGAATLCVKANTNTKRAKRLSDTNYRMQAYGVQE